MSEVIRYAVYGPDNLGISADGDLVRFEDYDALREQNRVLRLALEPFAKVAEAIEGQVWVQYLWVQSRQNPKDNVYISAEHVRAASAALTAASQPAQKPSGPTVSCNVANCWSCKDATSQEGQHGSR